MKNVQTRKNRIGMRLIALTAFMAVMQSPVFADNANADNTQQEKTVQVKRQFHRSKRGWHQEHRKLCYNPETTICGVPGATPDQSAPNSNNGNQP